jgi:hypothetical protein
VATHCAVSAETHALAVRHAYLNPANVMLDEPDISTRGAGRFAAIGGSSIVDVTSVASELQQLTLCNPAAFIAGSEVLP